LHEENLCGGIAKLACFFVPFAATSLTALLEAQQSKDVAPIPVQIIAARKVFISNAGQESVPGAFSGEPDRTYNQFYGAIKNWGQYELVSAPADADLVLEISFTIPSGG
jgi:hypothetical protein